MGRILLVEDNPSNADIATAILVHAGHDVTHAPNGLACLECLAGASFDVIVMDVLMPGLDGLSATRLIRGEARHAALPIIGVTAVVDPTMVQTLRAAGMDAVLTKPYRTKELRDLVEAAIARRPWPAGAGLAR